MSVRILATGVAVLAVAGIGLFAYLRYDPPEDERTAWTYHSPEHGFAIRLPSDQWRAIPMPEAAAGFEQSRKGIQVLVEVVQESKEAFLKDVAGLQDHIERNREFWVGKPQEIKGETSVGNPYTCWTMVRKDGTDSVDFVARSLVWCKDKELTVGIVLQKPLRKKSGGGLAAEKDYYENAARTLCLSVE
jgi:hypothetical protein